MISVRDVAQRCVRGALESEISDHGDLTFHRTPRAGRSAVAHSALDYVSATPSGVRLEGVTDASVIEVEFEILRALYPGTHSEGSVFDVVVDGVPRAPLTVTAERIVPFDLTTGGVDIIPGRRSSVRIELGAGGRSRVIEIWFPVVSVLTLIDVRIPAGAVLRPFVDERPVWVHHGSSISQASDAGRALLTWPVAVARSTGRSLVNLGLAGQCHLDPFMARAIRDAPASVISLELGINIVNLDSMRERTFTAALQGFLDTIRDGHPLTPILVVSPLACPAHENDPGPTLWGPDGKISAPVRSPENGAGALTVSRIRQLIDSAVGFRRARGDHALHVLDGRVLLGPDDVDDLSDGLHPSVAGQSTIAKRFAEAAFGSRGHLSGGCTDGR